MIGYHPEYWQEVKFRCSDLLVLVQALYFDFWWQFGIEWETWKHVRLACVNCFHLPGVCHPHSCSAKAKLKSFANLLSLVGLRYVWELFRSPCCGWDPPYRGPVLHMILWGIAVLQHAGKSEDVFWTCRSFFSALGYRSFAMTTACCGCVVAEFTHEFREKTILQLAETCSLSYFSS